MGFNEWMKSVDNAVWAIVGCSVYDLPDTDYALWYEDELTPEEAATRAIKEAI